MLTKTHRKALVKLWEGKVGAEEKVLEIYKNEDVGNAFLRAWGEAERKPYDGINVCRIPFPGLINFWKEQRNYESWHLYFIVEGSDTKKVLDDMEAAGYAVHGWDRGIGRSFANSMWARKVGKNRILVSQWGGLDV